MKYEIQVLLAYGVLSVTVWQLRVLIGIGVDIEDGRMDQTTTNSVEQRIQTFLMEKFPLARRFNAERDTALLEKGILDSLGILDVVSFLENEFSIMISDEDLVPENFQSLGTISIFVRKKAGKEV